MVWVRLDDRFTEHPKVAAVGPLGMALWVAGLAYCNRNLTDGFIPWAGARTLLTWSYLGSIEPDGRRKRYKVARVSGIAGEDVDSEHVIDLLVSGGLWEETEDGYRVHDFEDYQPTRAAVEAERDHISAVRSEAGRLGGLSSGAARAKQNRSKTEANTQAKREQNGSPVPVPVPTAAAAGARERGDAAPDEGTVALRAWEQCTGATFTPTIAARIDAAVDEHGLEAVLSAIEETAAANVRSWKYASAILTRWKREGRPVPSVRPGGQWPRDDPFFGYWFTENASEVVT